MHLNTHHEICIYDINTSRMILIFSRFFSFSKFLKKKKNKEKNMHTMCKDVFSIKTTAKHLSWICVETQFPTIYNGSEKCTHLSSSILPTISSVLCPVGAKSGRNDRKFHRLSTRQYPLSSDERLFLKFNFYTS